MDHVRAWARDLWFGIQTLLISWPFEPFEEAANVRHYQVRQCKLAIIIHGLKGSPRSWHQHRRALSLRGWDTLIPSLPNGGSCSMEECVQCILDHLERLPLSRYASSPENTIAIFGESNGTRVMHFLRERLLQLYPELSSCPLRMVSIAGFFEGIPWTQIPWINWFLRHILNYHSEVLRTFAGQDDTLRDLLRPQCTLYLASPQDTRYIPLTSSIPPASPHVLLARGYGHCSVKHFRIDDQISFVDHISFVNPST